MQRTLSLLAAAGLAASAVPSYCLQRAQQNVASFATKIVGGVEASPGEFPFMVSLHDSPSASSGSFCGGSLIGDKWVMTAAHCGNIPYVVIGGHDQNNPDECAEVLRVVKTVAHPQYDDWTTENDVAVLELERVSAYAPVRAALYQSELAEGRTVTVAGWGTTQEGGSTSSVLRKVNVPVSNQADCYSAYDIVGAMRDTVICAGLEDGGKDSCQGDSGGPLFVPSSSGDGFEVAGIVSFGIGCAQPGYAGVYTKVSAFKTWVCNQIGGCAPPAPTAPTSPTTKNPTPAPTSPTTAPPTDDGYGGSCSDHSDCPVGDYCDEFGSCFTCDWVETEQCDSFDGDCCSSDFEATCPNINPLDCGGDGGGSSPTSAPGPIPPSCLTRARKSIFKASRSTSKIVGGVEASPGEFPFMVSLHDSPSASSGSFCGGSLIGDKWVMTAAHCGNIPYVVIGGHDQNNPDECAEVLRVVKTVAHPQYDDWTTENDVAVLELERVSAYAPVRAALYQSELAEGRTVTVAGWGTTQEGGSTSSVLRKVNVPVSNQADCYSAYDIVGAMRDTVICAGLEDGGKDSCQGDSGGPLFVPSSSGDGFEVAGIVSFGIGCAQPGYAGVYTKVSAFKTWVCNQIGGCAPPAPSSPAPTPVPTNSPTVSPTKEPTATPTKAPTAAPTKAPTKAPTDAPTANPTATPTAAPTAAELLCPVSDDDDSSSNGGFDWGSGCASGSGCFTLDLPVESAVEDVGMIPAGKFDVFVRLEAEGDIDIRLYDIEYLGDDGQWPEGEGQAVVAWCGSTGCNGWTTIGMGDGRASATYVRQGIEPMTVEYSGYNGQNGNFGDEYIRITGATTTPLMMRAFAYATGRARVTYSWGESRDDCCTGYAPCIGTPFTQPVAAGGILPVGEIPAGKRDITIRLATPDGSDVDVQLYDLTETDPFDEGKAIIAWCDSPNTCNFGVMNGPTASSVFYPDSSGPEYFWSGYNGQDGNLGDETIRITGTSDRPLMMKVFGYTAGEAIVTYEYWNPRQEASAQQKAGRGRSRGGSSGRSRSRGGSERARSQSSTATRLRGLFAKGA